MTNTQRAAFEAWARTDEGNCNDSDLKRSAHDDEYVNKLVQRDWEVWQAAQAADAGREAVAVIGSDFQLLYTDPGSITAIAKKHGLKVGDTLYKRPTAHSGPVAWQVRRADGRIDGVPIQWENCTKELYEATLATGRYAGYENGPRCEVRALTIDGSAINAELVEALEAVMQVLDEPAGCKPEIIADKGKFKAFMDQCESRVQIAKSKARAALSRAKEQT